MRVSRTVFPPIGALPYMLTLPKHGFYWFRLASDVEAPSWHEERLAPEDLPVLILFDGWTSFFRDRVVPWRIGLAEKTRTQLETVALPRYLESQRWYAAKGEKAQRASLTDHVLWQAGEREVPVKDLAEPYSLQLAGDFTGAAAVWQELGCAY